MKQAIDAYHQITVTPEFREAERLYEKARHNEAAALRNERNEKAKEIAKNLINYGDSTEKITIVTGLSSNEIESLRKNCKQ